MLPARFLERDRRYRAVPWSAEFWYLTGLWEGEGNSLALALAWEMPSFERWGPEPRRARLPGGRRGLHETGQGSFESRIQALASHARKRCGPGRDRKGVV